MFSLRYSQLILLMGIISLAYSQTEILDDPGFDVPIASSDWICNGRCTALLDGDSHAGAYSILIANRTKKWNGPKQQLNLDVNAAVGVAYHISGFAKIVQSNPPIQQGQKITLTVFYLLQDGTKKYRKPKILNDIKPNNGWVNLAAEYKFEDFGKPITRLDLYVEGPDLGVDFLVDTMSVIRAQLLNNSEFEKPLNSSTDWFCGGACIGSLSTDSFGGNNAMLSSARSATWQGPNQYLQVSDPNVLVGKAYYFSAHVKVLNSIPNQQGQKFSLTLRYTLQDGSQKYKQPIAISNVVPSDGWVELAADYMIEDFGKPVTGFKTYIHGPDVGVDFLTDSFTITEIKIDQSWRDQAQARVELIRKGNLNINVASSGAHNNVTIKIEQLKHEFAFGSAVDSLLLQNNAAYRQWYLDNFEWAVLHNDMKWRQTEWNEGVLTWEKAENALDILEANGKKTRGHTILWGKASSNPNWVQSITDPTQMYNKCMKRIDDLLGKFNGRLEHWDVNNEMLPVNNNLYSSVYGSVQIRYDMFTRARQQDPNAKLFLNDFAVVNKGTRTNLYAKQALEFLAAGVQVDGMGCQNHLSDDGNPQGGILLNRLNRIATAGLPIFVTELDYVNPDHNVRAQVLEDALLAYFSHSSVEGVLFWGYWDQRHWRGEHAALVNGPNMTPNAAGLMWERLFHTDWRSNLDVNIGAVSSGTSETLSERVFYGDYKITALSGTGAVLTQQTVSMAKSAGSLSVSLAI